MINKISSNRFKKRKKIIKSRKSLNQILYNNKFISNNCYYNNNGKLKDHSLVKWEVDNLQLKCQNNHKHNNKL